MHYGQHCYTPGVCTKMEQLQLSVAESIMSGACRWLCSRNFNRPMCMQVSDSVGSSFLMLSYISLENEWSGCCIPRDETKKLIFTAADVFLTRQLHNTAADSSSKDMSEQGSIVNKGEIRCVWRWVGGISYSVLTLVVSVMVNREIY